MSEIYGSRFEDNIIKKLAETFDTTSVQIITALNTSTGVTRTGTFVDCSRYSNVMIWVDSSSVTGAPGGMTGLEVDMYARPSSGTPWGRIAIQSGIGAETTTLLKVRGTGLTASGIVPLRDLKVNIKNVSGSATATINAWLIMKGI